MNESIVALSLADDPTQVRWWVESDWRSGSWADFASALAGRPWMLLIDARAVSLFELSLPARDLATATRAAPFALEEQLATPLEDTAIALAARGDKAYTAAAWTRADLATLGATLATYGLTPALVVPEALSLPWTPDSVSIALRDDWAVLRTGPGSGCAVATASLAPALALVRQQYPAVQAVALYADPRAARRFPHDAIAGLACREHLPLDAAARQQALALVPVPRLLDASPRAAERRRARRLWRVAAVLALAGACTYPALLAYGTAVTTRHGAELEAANEARFRAAFPTITRVVNARVQAQPGARGTARDGPDRARFPRPPHRPRPGPGRQTRRSHPGARRGLRRWRARTQSRDRGHGRARTAAGRAGRCRSRRGDGRRRSGRGRGRRAPAPDGAFVMREWWSSRSVSERRLLGVGMGVIACALYFVLVVEPLTAARTRAELRLAAATALGNELEALAAEAAALRQQGDPRTPWRGDQPLLAVINTSAIAADTQRATRRLTPLGADAVTVCLDDVEFAALASWLLDLDTRYGVAVERASLDRVRPGVVDAQLTLRTRGPR